jgi:hypothetical protein
MKPCSTKSLTRTPPTPRGSASRKKWPSPAWPSPSGPPQLRSSSKPRAASQLLVSSHPPPLGSLLFVPSTAPLMPNTTGPASYTESPRSNVSAKYPPPNPDPQSCAPLSRSGHVPAPIIPFGSPHSPATSLPPLQSRNACAPSSAASAHCCTSFSRPRIAPSASAAPQSPVPAPTLSPLTMLVREAPCISPPALQCEYRCGPIAAPKSSIHTSESSAECNGTPSSDRRNIRTGTDSSPRPA